MTAYRITAAARLDFKSVLRETGDRFGSLQRETYKGLIATAVRMVAAEPNRPGSWDRGAIMAGIRTFHLDLAAARRGAASHALYYIVDRLPDGSACVVVLRLLHEAMDPGLHLARQET